MRMATILAAVAAILGALALAAAPAGAQEGGEGGALAYPVGGEPPPPPPDYAFRDGEVWVGGDSVVGCREFVGHFDEGYDEWGDQAQAERVRERCEEAGLPGLRIPAEVRREIRRDARPAGLPQTGGVPLSLLAAGLVLPACAAGLLALRKTG